MSDPKNSTSEEALNALLPPSLSKVLPLRKT